MLTQVNLLDVISRNTRLRRVAATHGGEYAGPCPFCGGRDRFRVWPDADRPGYWCRGCGRHGNAIQYLRDHDGLSLQEACTSLYGDGAYQGSVRRFIPPRSRLATCSSGGEPDLFWQDAARVFCMHAMRLLWSPRGAAALAYLRQRGLHDETIRKAALGYNPEAYYDAPELWGFPRWDRPLWIPAGIVIPWIVKGSIWCVRFRSCHDDPDFRYIQVRGGGNALYRADSVRAGTPAVVVEGEFDALTIEQEAGDLAAVVANGSSNGGRRARWIATLASASRVLLSHDADQAGDRAAAWWLKRLDNAQRWRPLQKDANTMLQKGADVRSWIESGLEKKKEA